MSSTDNIAQSNIFGQITTSGGVASVEPSSAETTAAGKLIDHLKYIADSALSTMGNRAAWLALAANAGQNGASDGIVQGTLKKPEKLLRSTALASWTLPPISASPLSLPNIPDNLKVDFAKLKVDATADVAAIQTSWMAKYLPDVTDASALNSVLLNVLNGSQQATASAKLDQLAADTKANLKAILDALLAALAAAATAANSNLATAFTNARTNLDAAMTTAKDNSTNIAWARARDQAAREAARLEAEAASSWAARGFSLPGGTLVAQSGKARQATLDAASAMAAQQAEKQQQMFFDVARATVDAWLREMDAQANAEISAYREMANAQLRAAELQLDADKFKAKQAFDHLGLTLDFTKFAADAAIKYRLGVIDGVNNLIRAYANLRSNETEYLNAIARAEREAQSAVLDYYRAAIASAEIGMRLDVTNNENDLRWATIAAQFIGTAVGHHVQAAGASADVFARAAGMALSGLNAIASVATSS